MKVGNSITKSDFEKPYDKEIFSTLIRVLKDAGLFKNFTKKHIFDTCYGSRMKYSDSESPTRNATYWLQDLRVNDGFFIMLYKGRLIKGILYDVLNKKYKVEYKNLASCFLSSIWSIEESLKYDCNINTKKQLVYEFDEILDFIDEKGIEVHTTTRKRWNSIKAKILCS